MEANQMLRTATSCFVAILDPRLSRFKINVKKF